MTKQSKHEKPLGKSDGYEKNNHNNITIDQHVIPRKHIAEWDVGRGIVNVFDIKSQQIKTIPPQNTYFCVRRLWDQWTESEMMRVNENNFQCQMDLIRAGAPISNHRLITEYYVLLCIRVMVANKERPDYPSILSSMSYENSKEELEDNEINMTGSVHIIGGTMDETSQYAARAVVKMCISLCFRQFMPQLINEEWLLCTSESDDFSFILSDALYNNFATGFHVLPITPRQVLIAKSTYDKLEQNKVFSVEYINKRMIANAVNYYIQA